MPKVSSLGRVTFEYFNRYRPILYMHATLPSLAGQRIFRESISSCRRVRQFSFARGSVRIRKQTSPRRSIYLSRGVSYHSQRKLKVIFTAIKEAVPLNLVKQNFTTWCYGERKYSRVRNCRVWLVCCVAAAISCLRPTLGSFVLFSSSGTLPSFRRSSNTIINSQVSVNSRYWLSLINATNLFALAFVLSVGRGAGGRNRIRADLSSLSLA